LMAHDAWARHARDELGISKKVKPRPIQAALSSAASFAVEQPCRYWLQCLPSGDSDSPCFWHFLGVPCTSGRTWPRAGRAGVMIGDCASRSGRRLAMGVTAGVGALVRKRWCNRGYAKPARSRLQPSSRAASSPAPRRESVSLRTVSRSTNSVRTSYPRPGVSGMTISRRR